MLVHAHSRLARWGVSRNAGRITESAHPLEKSAANFMITSIHRLCPSSVSAVVGEWHRDGCLQGAT
jgi:hypothetical protein